MKLLEKLTVLDFSRFAAGPICSAILADMGAEVIKIEKPGGEEDRTMPPFTSDGISFLFIASSHHKKAITLSLKTKAGEEILDKLVAKSDIVMHNFTPGTKEANTLQYDHLKSVNPSIILVAISAFGQHGPYAQRVGFDTIAQAMSGAMSFSGFPGTPPTRAAVPWVDFTTALNAALGIMFALYHRDKTGQGQMVSVSLLDSAIYLVAGIAAYAEYKMKGVVRYQTGNQTWGNSTNCFRAKDGWVMIGLSSDSMWKRLAKTIGKKELIDAPMFKDSWSRFESRDIVNDLIGDWIAEKTVSEVIRLLEESRVPCAPVLTVDQTLADPHIKDQDSLVDIEYANARTCLLSNFPIKLSLTPGNVEGPVPMIGEHNEEIYSRLLGLSKGELYQLEKEEVI